MKNYLLKYYLLFSICILGFQNNYSQDGSTDSSFPTQTGFDFEVDVVKIDNDGRIIAGGRFREYKGQTNNAIIALNSDGTINTSFYSGEGDFLPLNRTVLDVAFQGDGKILVGGFFTTFAGETHRHLVRLNNDGSIDHSFDIGTGFNHKINEIAIQPDGKIIAVGHYTSFNGQSINNIVRLNPDGSLDNTFGVGSGTNPEGAINTVKIQTDGKILLGGAFNNFNGVSCNNIIRLNPGGDIDSSFDVGTGPSNGITEIELYNDGRILVGGLFLNFNGVQKRGLVRLHSDGSIDDTFHCPDHLTIPYTLLILPDNKIIAGGSFYSQPNIVRLHHNGEVDTDFDVGNGANERVYSVFMQPDGKLLVGGQFNIFNNMYAYKMVRLHNTITLSTEDFELNKLTIYPNPVSKEFFVHSEEIVSKLTVFNVFGKEVFSIKNINSSGIDISMLSSGVYLVQVEVLNSIKAFKIVKK